MTTQIKSSDDLLSYLVSQAGSGQKNWFGFAQQRLTGIALAHDIAKNHADKMTPDEIVSYALELNEIIYQKIVRPTTRY
jgi:hypothetical protein